MPYGWQILLNGVDISEKVSNFEITEDAQSYCRELTFGLLDKTIYNSFDFLSLPETPTIEVKTRITDTWVSQGLFFVERPSFREEITSSKADQVWGRSLTARLGSPFAVRITKAWTAQTSFFGICQEMCEASGITWDPAYCEIEDFVVFPHTFQVDGAYPIEVISELARLGYGDSAFITTDRLNHLCIRIRDYSPAVADVEITDTIIASVSEDIEWPDFGNRVKVSASGIASGYSVALKILQPCLSSETDTGVRMLARVTDQEGEAVIDGTVVDWSVKYGRVTLQTSQSNTQSVYMYDELQTAKSFCEVDLDFPPSQILGIYARADYWKTENLAAAGVLIDGNTVTLLSSLKFCDQALRIDYVTAGVAVNFAFPGANPGTDLVTASVSGNSATEEIYVDNPCACVPSISLKANPSSIKMGSIASLLVYVENGGSPLQDGRKVYLSIVSTRPHGKLSWTENHLLRVNVTYEESRAVNEVSGVTQCDTDMFIESVSGVWVADEEGNKTGGNLYSSFAGKRITLNTSLQSDTALLVDYKAIGAVACDYKGLVEGTERFRAWIHSSREAPIEAFASITVTPIGDDDDGTDDDDPSEGLCEEGKISCEEGKVFGMSGGIEGCYEPWKLDVCLKTASIDKRYCYKKGQLGCWPIADCDAEVAGNAARECPQGTVCCENIVSGVMGCWPPEQCKSDDNENSNRWNNKKIVRCQQEGKEAQTCKEGEICCWKDGVYGCFKEEECDESEGKECYPEDCSKYGYSKNCLNGRFSEAQKRGCDCREICDAEFAKYGAIQSTMSNQGYKTVHEKAEEYGEYGSPEYWEAHESIKKAQLDECFEKCDQCKSISGLNVSGSDAVTKPGQYHYSASGAVGEINWSVSGTGVTVDQNGNVSLAQNACGSFTVSARDECGQVGSKTARITNAGRWVFVDQGGCYYDGCLWGVSSMPSIDVYSGEYWITFTMSKVGTCQDASQPPTPSSSQSACPWSYAPGLVWDQGSGPINALCWGVLCGYLGWWWTANYGTAVSGWYRRRWTC